MKVAKNVKQAIHRLIDRRGHVAESAKAADNAFRRLAEISKQVRLLQRKTLVLKLQLSKMEIARDVTVSNTDGRLREVRDLVVRVHKVWDDLDSLKRLELANCNLEDTTRKVADAQGPIVGLGTA